MTGSVQAALRHAFMAAEAVFNRAFGDRLNPLYHLGAITFFLFWVVAASGLYLYAFFRTGVPEAYSSVEALTHGQWWVGGILRSVHRYASDAMVLLMGVHMLRHYAYDRLRGFRSFSWLTGVALIWLVYISGINGYMLPWDRLAQFTIVTSFQLMDSLPGLGGTLVRNFLYPESVNDRFFSLLAFIHIGVPLLVLLLMFVHVQRVPKAATNPPRPIALGVSVMLLLLSILLPVHSQGGVADLATEVGALALDWFYLPLLPLIDDWAPSAVWGLLLGGTLLLCALPWVGRRGTQRPHQVALHPGSKQLAVRPGETLLEAGLRAGLALPYDCRNGGCGVCLCHVMAGRVDHGAYQPSALTAAMRANGKALMCCAVPLDDLVVEVDVASLEPGAAPAVSRHVGRIERMERLAPQVMRLWVALPAGERIEFAAGQYLNIILDDGQRRAFSFAQAPQVEGAIELHVRLIPGGRFTTHVFEAMKVGDTLHFEAPLGRFTLHASERPILFIAGATGFAPIKSIVEDAFHRGIQRPMHLYWGVRQPEDLYCLDLIERWQREHPNFKAELIVSDEAAAASWTGRKGLVHEAMLADFPDLRGHEVYVCGSVQMVNHAVPDFLAHGLAADACFSDAFHPALAPTADPRSA
jgi:NAD(P)H-flavin reductase/quinol-cytochrome oxidoreductase complex cytochrome b subunit